MRRTILTALAAVAVLLGVTPAGYAGTAPAAAASPAASVATADDPVPGKLLLMLDASGSMKASDPSGLSKIEAAKKALTGVVSALPESAQVGLRVYGATVDGHNKPTAAACADSRLVHPVGPLDRAGLTKTITAITALGETPIAHSLTEAMKDLGADGKRNIVLVSDGEESCVPDPCPVVKKLTANGIDLQIDTVGFGVNADARQQLQCIADAGNGTYYDARDADALTSSLSKLSQRALRPFSIDGTPVTATPDQASAPVLEPGRFRDTFAVGADPRYLRIKRTPGSVVHVSLVARPMAADRGATDAETWEVTLQTPDGEECDSEYDTAIEFFRSGSSMTAAATAGGWEAADPEQSGKDEPCASSPELVAALTHKDGAPGEVPVQLAYIEEPPVTNLSALPEGVDSEKVTPLTAKPTGAPVPVVGGGGFADAPTLAPGTFQDTILPGEQIYYRVRLDFGQRAALTADIGAVGPKPTFTSTSHNLFTVDAWTPSFFPLTRAGGDPDNRENLSASSPQFSLTEYTPEVRYRNKRVQGNGYHYPALQEVSQPGYYYFAVGRATEDSPGLAIPLTVRLNIAVEGEPTGKPAYAGLAPDASASPSVSGESTDPTTEEDTVEHKSREADPSPFAWIFGGLIGVLGLGAVVAGALRRKGSGRDDDTVIAEDRQPHEL
ncbi:VWA domain-containing protein [Knoellia subterranea]|uniref:VWFA domain-containing protein n=1 Tax=Knoellia subterranea KCTC 19937 TaxID=1385521 RepID=A0A0A0JLG0_9MICO|nr:VWA domain-containing protein [Knoellia subterranea]KGN36887.1 hypothetical protein N803_15855 [Knoellia subterranea KCTC 19937]